MESDVVYGYNTVTKVFSIFYEDAVVKQKVVEEPDGVEYIIFNNSFEADDFIEYLEQMCVDTADVECYSYEDAYKVAIRLDALV